MKQDRRTLAVCNGQLRIFAVLDFNLVRCRIHFVALRGFQFDHLIPTVVQLRNNYNSIIARYIITDDLAVQFAHFKDNAGDSRVRFLILFDER